MDHERVNPDERTVTHPAFSTADRVMHDLFTLMQPDKGSGSTFTTNINSNDTSAHYRSYTAPASDRDPLELRSVRFGARVTDMNPNVADITPPGEITYGDHLGHLGVSMYIS